MSVKKIVVLDTNFIIENNKGFIKVLEKLAKVAEVYIPRVVIHERLAQIHIELKQKYDKLNSCKRELASIATIKELEPFDVLVEKKKNELLASYETVIGKNIIDYNADSKTFSSILERVYNKIPPFIKGESDRGFKDTMLWLSLLDYFKDNGQEAEIFLITKDKGFLKQNAGVLEEEFYTVTAKRIKIEDSSYYKILIGEKDLSNPIIKEIEIMEFEELKETINRILFSFCKSEEMDSFGQVFYSNKFNIYSTYSINDLKSEFENMQDVLNKYLFSYTIAAQKVLSHADSRDKLNLDGVKELYDLYTKIKKEYAPYIEQFLITACDTINSNYDSDALPF